MCPDREYIPTPAEAEDAIQLLSLWIRQPHPSEHPDRFSYVALDLARRSNLRLELITVSNNHAKSP